MSTPEETAIKQLRTSSGWWNGDDNARRVLAEYRFGVIVAEQVEAERLRLLSLESQAREERE